jgi:hypothetical protein
MFSLMISEASTKAIAFAKKTTTSVSICYYKFLNHYMEKIHVAGIDGVRKSAVVAIDRYANFAYTALTVTIAVVLIIINLSITAFAQRLVLYYQYPAMFVSDVTLIGALYLAHKHSVGKTLLVDWLKSMADNQIARLDDFLLGKYDSIGLSRGLNRTGKQVAPLLLEADEFEQVAPVSLVAMDEFEVMAPVPVVAMDEFEVVAPVPVVAMDEFEVVAPVPVVAMDEFEVMAPVPVVAMDEFEVVAPVPVVAMDEFEVMAPVPVVAMDEFEVVAPVLLEEDEFEVVD